MIKTIFRDISSSQNGNLKDHPKLILKLNSLIASSGIKSIESDRSSSTLDDENLFRKEMTMITNAVLQSDHSNPNFSDSVLNFFESTEHSGYLDHRHTYNVPNLDHDQINITIKINGTNNTFTIGSYLKERNVLLIYIPLFYVEWNQKPEVAIEIIEKTIEEFKKLKPKKVNIDKILDKIRLEKFVSNIRSLISDKKSRMNDFRYEIEDRSTQIIDRYKGIDTMSVEIVSLEKLLENKEKIVKDKIKEIKALPFVKKVELTADGIAVYIGNINLNHEKQSIPLGRFRIYLGFKQVKILNLDAIKYSSSTYDSPHVQNRDPCFGSWNVKVNELIAKLDFKNLVLLIKMYLQTYNPASPHISIDSWNTCRKYQKIREGEIPEASQDNDRHYLNKLREEDYTTHGEKYNHPSMSDSEDD